MSLGITRTASSLWAYAQCLELWPRPTHSAVEERPLHRQAFGAFATEGIRTLSLADSGGPAGGVEGGRGFGALFPGIERRLITLPINFRVPFARELLLFVGACTSAAATFRRVLRRGPGAAVVVVVGGAEESTMVPPLGGKGGAVVPRLRLLRSLLEGWAARLAAGGWLRRVLDALPGSQPRSAGWACARAYGSSLGLPGAARADRSGAGEAKGLCARGHTGERVPRARRRFWRKRPVPGGSAPLSPPLPRRSHAA